MITDEWHGCYKRGWGKELVPTAYVHPAKVSYSLAERVYDHLVDEQWIAEGATVVDPFAGIGGFAYHALKRGLNFIGVELEPKFVDLAAQNIALWNQRYAGRFARWGTARIIQGDSRRLADVVREASGVVSSPPFGDSLLTTDTKFMAKVEQDQRNGSRLQPGLGEYGSTPGNLGNLRATDAGFDSAISSPPFAEQQSGGGLAKPNAVHSDGHQFGDNHGYQNQADTDGNLAALRATDAGFSAAVSSPPYADGAQHTGGDDPKPEHIEGGELRYVDYGQSAGQLAAMRSDGFDGAVSSPPYEEALSLKGGRQRAIAFNDPDKAGFADMPSTGTAYSASNDNIGNSSGDDFWNAARLIVEQTYAILHPDAHAVWVVKSFVRNKQIVDFPAQWRQLCEACGFVTLHEHHALLVRDDGTQFAMDGNHKSHRRERKSFFRRLAESKGSPRIDHETVYCMVKQ